jgi:glycosyltransferase involved in cell wall biosynthesis
VLKERGVDFICRIVGQGPDQVLLEERIACNGLGGHVELVAALPNHEVPGLLEAATVFALPCVIARDGDRDGMPLVLIEAMARGVPVVSSDVIGLPELVRDGAGYLAPPGDPVALADALQTIAAMPPEARQAMGQAGRRIVEAFDAAKGTRRLLDLIEDSRDDRVAVAARPDRIEQDVVSAF